MMNSQVSYLNITEASGAGQRIDNYLVNKLKGVPRSKIYNILRKGEVRVNKGRIKPDYRLQENDIVRVPPLVQSTPKKDVVPTNAPRLEILYETSDLLIINKPSGLAVHGGSGIKFGLIELLRAQRPSENLELIHRIDRDTSGCIMVAKNAKMLRAMHALLREGKIQKDYHALVQGYVAGDFSVNEPLKKFVLSSGERIVKVNKEEGQVALTKFVLVERYKGASLLKASPITGRTHQIRVHCAHRGIPIIGDDKYGNKQQKSTRMFLHARQLIFNCPLSGEMIAVQADYDQKWMDGIKQWQTK